MRRFGVVFNENRPALPASASVYDAKPIVESNSYGYVKLVANVRMRRDALRRSLRRDPNTVATKEY